MTTLTPTPADALIAALHEPGRENLLDLVRNPLRLTLLCMTWDGSSLPDTQAELYARYLKEVYQWNRNLQELRDHAQRCGTNITNLKQELNRQLGELAKAALNLPQERFRLSQALVEEFLGEELDETSLGYLALRLGWLNRVGRDKRGDSILAFYHATFQEYFAALAVEDWDYFLPRNHVDCPVAGKRYRIFEPHWKQVILLWLGREDVEDEEKEGFIRALVEFEDGARELEHHNGRGFYEFQAYFLAAVAINQFKTCSLAADIVRQVVKWGFGYLNVEKQEWQTFLERIEQEARKSISETIRQQTILELIAIIENCPFEWTLCQVAESLGEIDPGNSEAIAALVELIRTSDNQNIQKHAVERLEKIGKDNPEAIAGLLKILRTTEDENVRGLAAVCLENIGVGNPEAIARLLELIHTTEDENVRGLAAVCLENIGVGNPEAIARLLELIRTTEDENVRGLAAISLEKIGVGNPETIAGLLKILRTTEDEHTRLRAAMSLSRIAPENAKEVIAVFLEILRTTEDEHTRSLAAISLGEIGVGNPEAITGLLEFIRSTKDEDIYRYAARCLVKIIGNPEAITVLLEILRTTQDESTRRKAAWSLGKIGVGNPEAIAGLLKILRTTEDEFTRLVGAESLGKIDPGNPEAIAGLLEVIRTTEDEYTRLLAAESLGEIEPENPKAIAVLLEVICSTTEDQRPPFLNSPIRRRMRAFSCLSRMGQENPEVIAALLEILRTTEHEYTLWKAAESLEKIGEGNSEAIAGLLELIHTTDHEFTRLVAPESLGKIDPGNPEAIAGLLEVIRTTENEDTRLGAAWGLEDITPGNPEAIAGLVKVTETTDDEDTRNRAASKLQTILTTRQHYAGAVSALKHNLSDEVYQNNFGRCKKCYEVLWNCAENLPYPQFDQAWHHPTTTPHPEVEDTTPVASTPFTQHCNLALLPQSINQAIQSSSRPPNCQIICIDGSRFSDPSNPALQIYTALKKAGCPASADGKPRTIGELQAYCEDDLSEEKIALIFYEAPTDPPPQGFDRAVLNQLARFSHPPIAVVVGDRLPECRLPQFLESEPDLIANILQWSHNLER